MKTLLGVVVTVLGIMGLAAAPAIGAPGPVKGALVDST